MNATQNAMRVVSFAPSTFIELDDPMTGQRRLALVADSGTEFFDYIDHENPPTPLAILDVLAPAPWGDCRAVAADLLIKGETDRYVAFSRLLLALADTPAAGDPLTYNRAAKHAFDTRDFDAERAARAGLVATADAHARQAAVSRRASEWIAEGLVS